MWRGKSAGVSCARRFATGLVALAAVATATTSHAAAPPSEASRVVGQLWNRLLTHCGESYFYAGSLFDRQGMLSDVGAGQHPSVIEYRGVKFNTVPIRVTDAERLNGISYRGRVTMLGHVYRIDGGLWMNGPDLQPRNTNDIMGQAFASVLGDMGQIGTGGAMAFELVESKGKWFAARSSASMSGPLTFGTNFYNVEQIEGNAAPKYSCTKLDEMVHTSLSNEAAAKAKEDHEEAVKRAWAAPGPTHDAQRGIPYLLLTASDVAALRQYYAVNIHERMNDQMLFAAEGVVHRYPIVPSGSDWLPVGTTFKRLDGIRSINPENGYNKLLVVVTLTSGPHSGAQALIEADNYGSRDQSLPGRVWRTSEEGVAAERRETADALEADKKLVRDPVRGEPFLHVSEDEVSALRATYTQSRFGNPETINLQQSIGSRFPSDPGEDQWLAPGTAISPVLLGGANGSGLTYWTSKRGGKALALVHIDTGAHAGEMGLIDLRNYASNVRVICPPEPEALACYSPAEAEQHRLKHARDEAQYQKEKPLRPSREAPWIFSGNVADFETALNQNLNRRAAQIGVDPASFHGDVEGIVRLVRACTSVTQAEYEATKNGYTVGWLSRIRPELRQCQQLSQRISAPRNDAWIVIDTSVGDWSVRSGEDGNALPSDVGDIFHIIVYLYPKDKSKAPAYYEMNDLLWIFGVIGADLPFSQTAQRQ